jgi:triosephosphate isomerase
VGETLEQRESDAHWTVIEEQVRLGLQGISAEEMKNVVIAYEPVWAIGTGKTATSAQAQEVHAFIRTIIEKQYGDQIAQATRILYGGSVKPDNAKELFAQADIDGGLIGGAALKARDFFDIIQAAV